MIDYDKIEKAKELWSRYEEFDKQWLGTRGVFNIMHKVGMLDDEDHKEILEHYDRMLAPVTKFQNEVKAKIVAKVSKVAWNTVVDNDDSK
jgi:hypothetical protein